MTDQYYINSLNAWLTVATQWVAHERDRIMHGETGPSPVERPGPMPVKE